ncbi:hypothetical protein P691DRAFT_717071 [Macrolepiota fuliginosa MF-IS2]|uniref:DUF6699 domain-containing protein n=1 Tax=Macrolepiota fuliginosa MF-IS2 TaxID=1400762 RepID=A0A9P5XPJ2_9AGAR|nr:hypothetical protein P691DRAFT_717071 [Macrolepiota fuliginosa MF-IS2]
MAHNDPARVGGGPQPSGRYWPGHPSHPGYVYPRPDHYYPAHYPQAQPHPPAGGPAWGHAPGFPHYPDPHRKPPTIYVSGNQNYRPTTSEKRVPDAKKALPRKKSVEYPSDIALDSQLRWHHTWSETSSTGLIWDITRSPSGSIVRTERFVIAKPDLKALAMRDWAGKEIELWTDNEVLAYYMRRLWGPVLVTKKNPGVSDLLEAIYAYLSTSLTKDDIEFIRSTPENVGLLENARKSRVRDGFDAVYEAAIQRPFRRSDALGGHRRFQGIRAVKMEGGTDRLYFNLGPGPVPRF